MIKEDVDSEEIADVVSKWTGIPVSKMLEGEKQKLLRLEEELSFKEIAQVVDAPLGTVLARMHKAKKRLRAQFNAI